MSERQPSDEKWYYTFLPYNIAGGGTNNLIPLFMAQTLKASVAEVGIVSAITSAASVPANILWGNLSDMTKRRKPFILLGFAGMAAALIMMGIATSLPQYYIANFLMGLLAAAVAPVGTVLVLESFAKAEWGKRLGDFSKVGGIGWVLGLIIGIAWLMVFQGDSQELAMRALFLLSAVLCLVALVLAVKWVPESKEKIDRSQVDPSDFNNVHLNLAERARYLPQRLMYVVNGSFSSLRLANFSGVLKRYYVIVFLAFCGFLSFYVALPIFLYKEVMLSNAEVFIVYLASSIASALTYGWMGRRIGEQGGKRIQMICFGARVVIFPAFFMVTLIAMPFEALFVVLLLLHAGAGLCWAGLSVAGNSIVGKLAFKEHRTQSLGMYNSVQGLATIFGSLVGGFVAAIYGYEAVFLMASGFIVVALMLLLLTDVDKEQEEAISG
ncbi:MAG: drug efflux system protein MdtG [Methanomassiliicoccales archaeon PtaU1.Bin124]|nr:MAG: drug efflux system protein MdtG [Methanomassiliicoccales archaeon PtaU1.Bin124]